ncbi:MAG: aldolase/citrate lyase family protein [Armatimonadetes bacterium]|nr:aldolase/citrate lyase family protein [Armatimonadota bacterium]
MFDKLSLKGRLKAGETCFGIMYCEMLTPAACRIAKNAGYDFVIIDTEHNMAGVETVAWMCRAGRDVGLPIVVRAPAFEGQWLTRYLDLGAAGILVPRVETADETAAIVRAIKYPPEGVRGLAGTGPHTDYERPDAGELVRWANENLLLAVQIETRQGLENRHKILSVRGVDALFIGPYDLSLSLGRPGELDHPDVVAAMDAIFETAREHGVAPGMHVFDVAGARKWLDRGARFLAYSTELALIERASREALSELRCS